MEVIDITFYSDLLIILISILCGFLLGIERTRVDVQYDVRDHIFVSVLATILVLLNDKFTVPFGYGLIILIFGGIIAFLILSSLRHRTTTLSMFLALIVGVLCYYYYSLAIVISVLFLIVLSTKKQFKMIRGLSSVEWTGTVEFIALVFLLYTLIPDGLIIANLNVKAVIIIFISILAIRYFSYFLLKSKMERTIYYLSFFGGLAHSEATTIELSKAGASPSSVWLVIQTMLIRILIILVIAPIILFYALAPILITSMIGLFGSFIFLRKNPTEIKSEKIGNPLSIKSALVFSGSYSLAIIISLLVNYLHLTLFSYSLISFMLGLLAGGAAALFITSNFIGGYVNIAESLFLLAFGLTGAIINKIFYSLKFLNENVNQKKYGVRLLTYQAITIVILFLMTFLVINIIHL